MNRKYIAIVLAIKAPAAMNEDTHIQAQGFLMNMIKDTITYKANDELSQKGIR